MSELPKTFDPAEIEQRWYAHWESTGQFRPDRPGAEPWTIVNPPPNVTGSLHIGHALDNTLQDILARHARLQGKDALWVVGTDHAGIATQMVVERQLNERQDKRTNYTREQFVEKVWTWKEESGGEITQQLRRLGCSMDWANERFTMDEGFSKAVLKVFVDLHKEGLIYRDKRLVNWDPGLGTAISDLEVETREIKGSFWHLRYPLADGSGFIEVATTRPETMLADMAVAVNAADERYTHLVGKHVKLPITGRLIPIITDDHADPELGSGAVKITPGHDFNDFEVGKRAGIAAGAMLNMLDAKAQVVQVADGLIPDAFLGLTTAEARKAVVAQLKAEGFLIPHIDKDGTEHDAEPRTIQTPYGDRSGVVIEPWLTDQWYVDAATLAKPAIEAVRSGAIQIVPKTWEKTYFNWMENIQPWCVSRQLWWGHRIPAWFDEATGSCYVGRSEEEVRAKHNLGSDVVLNQESDVLETWFSSQLWPFSTLGWPNEQAMAERGFDRYLPSSVLITGFDIIFFWVARMIMATDNLVGKIPFKDVYFTGLIRDGQGQKMSKSKGNVLDPLDIIDGITIDDLVAKRTGGLMQPKMVEKIEKATRKEFPDGIAAHGADALRFTIAALATHGRDIKFDMNRAEGYKNFCNKLWNASRFTLMNTEGATFTGVPTPRTDAERWILARLAAVSTEAQGHYANYRFDLLAQCLYEFAWNEFCDWFLELSKPALNGADAADAESTRHTLLYVLEALLRLLHPLTPFITEQLWQQLAPRLGLAETTLSLRPYPTAAEFEGDFAQAEADVEWLKAVISAVRRVRSELNVAPSKLVPLRLQAGLEQDRVRIERFSASLSFLLKLDSIQWLAEGESAPPAAAAIVGELKLLVPLEGLVDLDAERARLDKEIKRVEGEQEKSETKLAKFTDKVPPAVVEQERVRLVDWNTQLAGLREQRAKL